MRYASVLLLIAFIAFGVADCYAYDLARYPERSYNVLYKLPGGGFAALIKFGRKDPPCR